MLHLPVSGIESIIFIIFTVLWAGLLVGGFILGTLNETGTRRMPLATRLLSTVVLVVAAWTWFAVAQGTAVVYLSMWVAIGITLGLIGDIFMSQLLKIEPHILYGMGAFALCHIAYIIGMIFIAIAQEIQFSNIISGSIFWWSCAILLWYLIVYRHAKRDILIFAALPYALLLTTSVSIAMLIALQDLTYGFIFIGALLFLVSDLLLAAQLFVRVHLHSISDVVWLLYGPGQMLIVLGVVLYTIIDSLAFVPL